MSIKPKRRAATVARTMRKTGREDTPVRTSGMEGRKQSGKSVQFRRLARVKAGMNWSPSPGGKRWPEGPDEG